jgi:8-oxo-dGTP diphosphatase
VNGSATTALAAEAHTDVVLKGLPVTLTWLDLDTMTDVPDLRSKIMGVCVVPVTADGRIVLAELSRGREIPGGGIEPADRDFVATARREAWEEARIELGELKLLQFIRIDRRDKPSEPSYAVIYAGAVTRMPPFERKHESFGRVVVSVDDYVARYGLGSLEDRRTLIAMTMSALAQTTVSTAGLRTPAGDVRTARDPWTSGQLRPMRPGIETSTRAKQPGGEQQGRLAECGVDAQDQSSGLVRRRLLRAVRGEHNGRDAAGGRQDVRRLQCGRRVQPDRVHDPLFGADVVVGDAGHPMGCRPDDTNRIRGFLDRDPGLRSCA